MIEYKGFRIQQATYIQNFSDKWFGGSVDNDFSYIHDGGVVRCGTIHDNKWSGYFETKEQVMAAIDKYVTSHSGLVAKLCKSGDAIAKELTGDDCHLIHMAVGISGESGELLDAVKKATIYRKPIDMENVIEELGDLEFYMEGLRQGLGITREQCLDANVAKLSKRYDKLSYSDTDAVERKDKQ